MKFFLMMTLVAFNLQTSFAQDYERDLHALRSLDQALNELTSKDLRCQKHHDCNFLPTGHKACGGPSGYVLVSKLNPDYEAVKTIAGLTQTLGRDFNIRYGVISDCMVMVGPITQCLENKCQNNQ